jgi:hypothetical protein
VRREAADYLENKFEAISCGEVRTQKGELGQCLDLERQAFDTLQTSDSDDQILL